MKHFIFLRLSALGDLIHCLPLYHSLVSSYPKSTIHWIVDQNFVPLIENLPQIKVHPVDKTSLSNLIISGFKIRKALKNYPIEAILNCHDSMSANVLSLFLPRSIQRQNHLGLDKNQARDRQDLFVKQSSKNRSDKNQHAVLQYLNLAQSLGIKTPFDKSIEKPINIAQYFDLNHNITDLSKDHSKIILLNLSTSKDHIHRNLSSETYQIIIETLIDLIREKQAGNENDIQYQLIFTGLKDSQTIKIAHSLEKLSNKKLLKTAQSNQSDVPPIELKIQLKNKVGQLNLSQWINLVQQSNLIISPDSAAVHLADAFQIPCLSIYLATNPKKIGPFQNQDLCLDYYQLAREKYLNSKDDWDKKIRQPDLNQLINQKELIDRLKRAFKRIFN